MRRIGAALAVLVLCCAGPGPASAREPVQPLFRLQDPRLTEVSGIAAGIASPGVVYVHNDSGDAARFFALDARTGAVLAVYRVPGAENRDWEDIAVARDAEGVPSVWIGDIGDNTASRTDVQLYRVDEPHVTRATHGAELTTSAPDVWRLRYPDGAVDAESLAVAPGGTAYVVTKSLTGASRVYAAPALPDPSSVQTLRQIGTISFRLTGTPGPFGPLGQLAATGADLSADGTRLAVRTYTDAYVWAVAGGDVATALAREPVRVALPRQPQGEGIAFDGTHLVIDSEKVGSTVYALPVPAVAVLSVPSGSPSVSPSVSPSPSPSPSESISLLPPVTGTHGRGAEGWVVWLLVAGAGLLIATPVLDRYILRREARGRGDSEV